MNNPAAKTSNRANDKLAIGTGLLALAVLVSAASAQDAADPGLPGIDISEWKCKFCEFEEGWSSEITLGIGYVTDDSFKFGEYNGLQDEGAYLIADAYARYRGEDAAYLDLTAYDLGLDTRSVLIEGGKQGNFDLYLRYDEIPHYISDSVETPYRGSDKLHLPSNWVSAGSTAGMTELDGDLHSVDLETKRKRLGVGFAITTESPWSYSVDLRHDEKDGKQGIAGAFFFKAAQLVEPIDYVTDEVDLALNYTRREFQASLAYYGSTFNNQNRSLTWENAYDPVVAGADEGQLALPPDNEFHQLSLSVAYQLNKTNRVSAQYAVGRMKQNERFLKATLNPNLVLPELPADDADAKIDTTNARLQLVSQASDNLQLTASFTRDKRDNKTPQRMYDWVTTDEFVNSPRSNLPYSYTRDTINLKADYDYTRGVSMGFGVDRDERERDFQGTDKTIEDSVWSSFRVRNIENLFLEVKLAYSQRDASGSESVSAVDPPQNPLMVKYNLADRDRGAISMYASFIPYPDYTVGIGLDFASDDYDNSEIGLTDAQEIGINLEASTMLTEATTLTAFGGVQIIESSQAGSAAYAQPDWSADTRDRFYMVGFGVNHALIEGVLDIGADISRSRSRGKVELKSGAPGDSFPDVKTSLDSFKMYLNYRVDDNLSLQTTYLYESYDSSDWAVDDVDPDTVSNLLAFGEDSPSYHNNVVTLSMRYQF